MTREQAMGILGHWHGEYRREDKDEALRLNADTHRQEVEALRAELQRLDAANRVVLTELGKLQEERAKWFFEGPGKVEREKAIQCARVCEEIAGAGGSAADAAARLRAHIRDDLPPSPQGTTVEDP